MNSNKLQLAESTNSFAKEFQYPVGRSNRDIRSPMRHPSFLTLWIAFLWCRAACSLAADIKGIAPGIPEPQKREVIVQLFNWPFKEVEKALPRLKELGYSHVHVSPAQQSNESVKEWWGRYQPIDFSRIEGPLGNENDFREMNAKANSLDMKIIADVVLNHMIDVRDMKKGTEYENFVTFDEPLTFEEPLKGTVIVSEKFRQFDPDDFHRRCWVDDSSTAKKQKCWLDAGNADLKTETAYVRRVAKDYLRKLVDLGVDGFRFDAAKHIEPDFFTEVLAEVPNTYAFGEVIEHNPESLPQVEVLDFYDFPLVAAMKKAFEHGGDLETLKYPACKNLALPGAKAVTFVRNHDIDRGQANDRGLLFGKDTYGVGWRGDDKALEEIDIILAYAYIFGRQDGIPYVFVDMPNTTSNDKRTDSYDDERLVAFIRFHNLCLRGQDGVDRREERFLDMKSENAIGWQRGDDRIVMINKAGGGLPIRDLKTTLKPGRYVEVHEGWTIVVESDANKTIKEWELPAQTAAMFVHQP